MIKLAVTCDVIDNAQYLSGGHVPWTVSKFEAFPIEFTFENVSNRTKTVTLIVLNTSNLRN